MCGIVGYVGNGSAREIIIDGLKKLEYRGYDSSGIAFGNKGDIEIRKCVGRISNLETLLSKENIDIWNIGRH